MMMIIPKTVTSIVFIFVREMNNAAAKFNTIIQFNTKVNIFVFFFLLFLLTILYKPSASCTEK